MIILIAFFAPSFIYFLCKLLFVKKCAHSVITWDCTNKITTCYVCKEIVD